MVSRYSDLLAMEAYFDALLSEPKLEPKAKADDVNRTPNPCNLSLSLPENKLKLKFDDKTENPALHSPFLHSPKPELLKARPIKQLLEELAFKPQHQPEEPQSLVTHLPKVAAKLQVQAEAAVVKQVKAEEEAILEQQAAAKIIAVDMPSAVLEPENGVDDDWLNIDTDNEFQVLFFIVAGVTFAVPLKELGGIHKVERVTPLFGKPAWYSGMFYDNNQAVNVVDTALWIMPEKDYKPDYKYYIMLDESGWGLSAETLIGTELLDKDSVLWRTQAGKRPWLAGMIKQKMCALLHVNELIVLLERGLDISGDFEKIE